MVVSFTSFGGPSHLPVQKFICYGFNMIKNVAFTLLFCCTEMSSVASLVKSQLIKLDQNVNQFEFVVSRMKMKRT